MAAKAQIPPVLEHAARRLNELWDWEPRRQYAITIALTAFLCALTVYASPVPQAIYGHDVFALLDGGWRVLNGQRPHVDFFTPLGPLTYHIMALGLGVSGLSTAGIGYGIAAFGFLLGLGGVTLLRRRLPFLAWLLLTIYVVLMAISPVPLGHDPGTSSYAMLYNRFGYALLVLLVLEALVEAPAGPAQRRQEFLGGLLSGVILALLAFLKVSFLLVAYAFVALFGFIYPRDWRRWVGLLTGGGAAVLLLLGYLGLDSAAVLSDLEMAAASRSQRFPLRQNLIGFAVGGFVLLPTLLSAFAGSLAGPAKARRYLSSTGCVLAAMVVYAGDLLLRLTNTEPGRFPLSMAAMIVTLLAGISRCRSAGEETGQETRTLGAICTMLAFTAALVPIGQEFGALSHALFHKTVVEQTEGNVRLAAPHLAGLDFHELEPRWRGYGWENSNGRALVAIVNDGIDLLRKHSGPAESVQTLELQNPFSFALLRPPARGGPTFLGYRGGFSEQRRPATARLFGNADCVMVPKQAIGLPDEFAMTVRTYLPEIEQLFDPAAESAHWRLYKRKKAPPG